MIKQLLTSVTLCAALPAHADVMSYLYSRMALVPPEEPCVALIEVKNKHGTYNRTEVLETVVGPVSVKYETVGGHNPTDHDLVEVVDMPEGVMAAPPHMELPDGETGYICILEWSGA